MYLSEIYLNYVDLNSNVKHMDSHITGVGYEKNTHSDSAFCKKYLNSRPDNAAPKTVIADGAYSGTEKSGISDI